MQNHLEALAIYNQKADKNVKDLIFSLTEAQRRKKRGSFYEHLEGLYTHLIAGSCFFLNALSAAFPEKNLGSYDVEAISVKDSFNLAESIDGKFLEFIANAKESDLQRELDFFGNRIDTASLLLKWANHGIHHRGQISQILDEEEIENNWSVLL